MCNHTDIKQLKPVCVQVLPHSTAAALVHAAAGSSKALPLACH